MRNIFIINPAAGTKQTRIRAESALKKAETLESVEIYRTKFPGDATGYVNSICAGTDEKLRFFACGGDGTLNEIVNGAAGFSNASVGCYPCGSGNDFVKCYGGADGFMDIEELYNGVEQYLDLIRVDGKYCINVCNFGLDAAVLVAMQSVKNKFIFKGKMAYFAGVAHAFAKNMRTRCKVTVDGDVIAEESVLLCAIANGQYYGGSFRCAPSAELDDGKLEVCLVKPISRLRFLTLMGDFMKGRHVGNPRFADVLVYRRGTTVQVESDEDAFTYALDGELNKNRSFTAEAVEKTLKFIVPEKVASNLHKRELLTLC